MCTLSCNWIVKCRLAVSAVVGVCLLALSAPTARAAEPTRELYVVDAKRPAVAVVDPSTWSVLASIPIDADPTAALLGRRGRFLYVLHNGAFRPGGGFRVGQGAVSVVDLQSRTQVLNIPLGWNTTDIAFSSDGRYLLCVSEGKAGKKDTPDTHGSVVVVDTETNAVTATLPAGRFGLRVAATADASRIFVLSVGELQKKKNGAPSSLGIFAPNNAAPLAEIPLGRTSRLLLAQDDRWLYALDGGFPSKKRAEHRNGAVHVVDVAAAKLATTVDVGTAPRGLTWDGPTESAIVLAQTSFKDQGGRLVRLHGTESPEVTVVGSGPRYVRRLDDSTGSLVVSYEDMRLLPDGRSTTGSPLVLNPAKGAARASATNVRLDGTPGELLPLPDQNRIAVSVLNPQGASSKVAILNLKENRVEHVLTTGRGSVKFGKILGAVALSTAMSTLSYSAGAMSAPAGSPFFYNVYSFKPAPPSSSPTRRTSARATSSRARSKNSSALLSPSSVRWSRW